MTPVRPTGSLSVDPRNRFIPKLSTPENQQVVWANLVGVTLLQETSGNQKNVTDLSLPYFETNPEHLETRKFRIAPLRSRQRTAFAMSWFSELTSLCKSTSYPKPLSSFDPFRAFFGGGTPR